MKKLVLTVGVLAVLALVGDRIALTLAEQAVATQLQASADLEVKPDVDIVGFPFLTQALAGTYDEVHVAAQALPTDGVKVTELEADLFGLEVPLGDALSGSVASVPVSSLAARARVSYADLARQSGSRKLTVARAGDRLAVTGSVTVLGKAVKATALSTVRLDGQSIVVRAQEYRVGNALADAALSKAIGNRFDLRVKVGKLPYALMLDGLRIDDEGVALTAKAPRTVLTRGALRG